MNDEKCIQASLKINDKPNFKDNINCLDNRNMIVLSNFFVAKKNCNIIVLDEINLIQ